MKVIISKDGIKREIETPFAVCMSSADMVRLAESFSAAAAALASGKVAGAYGWARIDPGFPDPDGPINSPPWPWTRIGP